MRTIADLPLEEEIPITFASVGTGPRSLAWRADAPATLSWVEALDGGDAGREAAQRDRMFLLAAPFQDNPVTLATLAFRFDGIAWGTDNLALVTENWWKTRRVRTWLLHPGAGEKRPPELLFDRSSEDRYGDPGEPRRSPTPGGARSCRTADGGRTIYLASLGASPEGDRPFLDALDLSTQGRTRRMFRSEAPHFEDPAEILDAAGRFVLVRREAVEEPAQLVRPRPENRHAAPAHPFPPPDAAASGHSQGAAALCPGRTASSSPAPSTRRPAGRPRTARCRW